jgi:hypothetical protein
VFVGDFDKCVIRNTKHEGIRWRKCQLKRKFSEERVHIVPWRSRYLTAVQHYQDNGNLMVYTHNTLTDSTLTFHKCWHEGENMGIHTLLNLGKRLIMLHVGRIM